MKRAENESEAAYVMAEIRRAQHGCRTGRKAFAVGVVMPDGAVVEFGRQGRTWTSEDDYHKARAGMEGRLIRHYPGAGWFALAVLLPCGTVVEYGGQGRTWPRIGSFLADAGGMSANVVAWFPAESRGRKKVA